MVSIYHLLKVSHDTMIIFLALEASVVLASPGGEDHQHDAENENHRAVGHDGVLGRDVVSDCICYCCLGRNGGHHGEMI